MSLKQRHGYEIIKQVQDDSAGKIKLGPGALYTSIKLLNENGLIEEVDDEQGGRRRYYRLTDAGRAALSAELKYYKNTLELARQRQVLMMGPRYV